MDPEIEQRIRTCLPGMEIEQVVVNEDGLVNRVAIVNGHWAVRWARDEAGRERLAKEARVLALLRPRVDLALPAYVYQRDDMVAYALLPGEPLRRNAVLRLPPGEQDALAWQLGTFLAALHGTPLDEARACDLPAAGPSRAYDDMMALYEAVRRELAPVTTGYARGWLEEQFAPLRRDRHLLDFEPRLVHGDLGMHHVLWLPQARRLSGIIDFGNAHLGDVASDLGVVIHVMGEGFLRRMAPAYPGLPAAIERARFLAGTAEIGWALNGLRTGRPLWYSAHLSSARDVAPVGSGWDEPGAAASG
jgi:aminoglycoside 2''-phosphotransferase